jgi:hypothetical protein
LTAGLGAQSVGAVLRPAITATATFALYALAPWDHRPDGAAAVRLAAWLAVFAAIFLWQLHAVMRSGHPAWRAVEAVAVSVPLLLVLFASTYVVTERATPGSFSEPLTRIDAMYFTVTVFATVGFGDVAARTETARLLVTVQMLVDLVLIGVIAKVLVGAVQRRRQALAAD